MRIMFRFTVLKIRVSLTLDSASIFWTLRRFASSAGPSASSLLVVISVVCHDCVLGSVWVWFMSKVACTEVGFTDEPIFFEFVNGMASKELLGGLWAVGVVVSGVSCKSSSAACVVKLISSILYVGCRRHDFVQLSTVVDLSIQIT